MRRWGKKKERIMFKSINEIDKFRYDDCVINKMIIDELGITLSVNALIVRADNSQNANYTESYADTTKIELPGGSIDKVVRDGCRVYDANDVLLKEIPDEVVDINSEKWDKYFEGQYLIGIRNADGEIVLEIEIYDAEGYGISDSFSVYIKCDDICMQWEKYLNRVSMY